MFQKILLIPDKINIIGNKKVFKIRGNKLYAFFALLLINSGLINHGKNSRNK